MHWQIYDWVIDWHIGIRIGQIINIYTLMLFQTLFLLWKTKKLFSMNVNGDQAQVQHNKSSQYNPCAINRPKSHVSYVRNGQHSLDSHHGHHSLWLYGEEQLRLSAKYLLLFHRRRKITSFEWQWQNDDKIIIFRWTAPLFHTKWVTFVKYFNLISALPWISFAIIKCHYVNKYQHYIVLFQYWSQKLTT